MWFIIYLFQNGFSDGKEELMSLISGTNQWKPLIFLLVFAFRGFFLIPPLLLVFISGTLFEPIDAFIYSLVGQLLSGILLYLIAQFVGREFVASHENQFFKSIDEALSKKGFFATLLLTLIPFVPADSVTIVAALTGISFADFLLGFFLGSMGIFVPFILLGQSLTGSESILWSTIPFLFLLIITLWAWKHPRFKIFFRRKK